MSEELLWAWAAGIIDGEGTIALNRIRQISYSAILSAEMSHHETINKLRRIFKSGYLYERKRNVKHSKTYTLQLNGFEAINVVRRLLPYLVTKREQAQLLIEYGEKCQSERGNNKAVSNEIEILRGLIYAELQVLNKRGPK